MDNHHKSLRIGAAAILCALVLRLFASGALEPLVSRLLDPNFQSFLIYLETGRNVRFSPSLEDTAEFAGESAAPVLGIQTEAPVFTAQDAQALEIQYSCDYRPDIGALLTQPLAWDLTAPEPTVLIIHTHTTESYTKASGESYTETSSFRTLDEGYNMLSIGDRLAQLLEAGGVTVIHDRELYDYPSYNGAYTRARAAIERWLAEYPSISLVLDLHRDASGDADHQLRTAVTVDGEDCARLMLVIGTDGNGLSHPQWQENLALGLKLQTVLEDLTPGITRPLVLRSQRFNQDLTTGSMIVEVGAAGNSHREALRSMELLAQAILLLARGSG